MPAHQARKLCNPLTGRYSHALLLSLSSTSYSSKGSFGLSDLSTEPNSGASCGARSDPIVNLCRSSCHCRKHMRSVEEWQEAVLKGEFVRAVTSSVSTTYDDYYSGQRREKQREIKRGPPGPRGGREVIKLHTFPRQTSYQTSEICAQRSSAFQSTRD